MAKVGRFIGLTTVTATGWLLMAEFLAAKQAVFQKGQYFAADQLIKLGSLVQRCQPKEWYNTKGIYGCTVPSEASSTAVQLKTALDNAEPTVSMQIHGMLERTLPEALIKPVTETMQGLAADMHASGIADIADKADLASLQARLALRCGEVLTTGPVCGTTNRAIAPLLDSMGSLGSGSPQELFYYGLAAVLTVIVGTTVMAVRGRAVTQPAPVVVDAPTAPQPAAREQPAPVLRAA